MTIPETRSGVKALMRFKAGLTAFRIRFPYTHSLSELLTLVAREEYEEAVSIAEAVIRWAEEMIGTSSNPWRL